MAVMAGGAAPEFVLRDQHGADFSLRAQRGRPVVLVFFPLAFSRTCRGELAALREHAAMFEQRRAVVAGISVDSMPTLRAWSEQEGFGVPLLSDFWPHGAVARAYDAFLPERGYASRTTVLVGADGSVLARFSSEPGEPRAIDDYRLALSRLD